MPVYITYICMCDVTNIVVRTTSAANAWVILLLAAQSALGDKHWIALSAGKQSPIVSNQPPTALAFSASTQHCAN